MRVGAIGRRVLGAVASAALAVAGLLVAPAAAAQAPPWYHEPPGGPYYAGFHVSSTQPGLFSRAFGTYGPVTLTRETNAPPEAFDWAGRDSNGDGTNDTFAWPDTWSGGGIEMLRADPFEACPQTSTTCQYYVTAGNGANFFFFQGTPPEVPGVCPDPGVPPDPGTPPDPGVPTTTTPTVPAPCPGTPAFTPESFDAATMVLAPNPIPQIHLGPLGAVGIAGTGGAAGKIHLDAPGTADDLVGSTLTYRWVLVHQSTGKTYTADGPSPFFEPTVEADGDYCVGLTVTASDGFSVGTPSCSAGGALFNITGVAPAPAPAPTPAPAPGPDPGGGGGIGGGGGGIPGIGFSNPAQRAPSTLTGAGGGASPTVIWLWRPEWFQPAPERNESPRTDGQPEVRGRRVIVVRSPTPRGASAGPWLAAVGIFGLLGGGWVVSRRRRLRMLAEL